MVYRNAELPAVWNCRSELGTGRDGLHVLVSTRTARMRQSLLEVFGKLTFGRITPWYHETQIWQKGVLQPLLESLLHLFRDSGRFDQCGPIGFFQTTELKLVMYHRICQQTSLMLYLNGCFFDIQAS